jgi:hypothetical protein
LTSVLLGAARAEYSRRIDGSKRARYRSQV